MKSPNKIKLHKVSKTLEIGFTDGASFTLSAEYLRTHSPSAEVQGHGSPVLQTGKKDVALVGAEAVGHYALKLSFDDGHDSGLFSWDYLYELGKNEALNWDIYLAKLQEAKASREAGVQVIELK